MANPSIEPLAFVDIIVRGNSLPLIIANSFGAVFFVVIVLIFSIADFALALAIVIIFRWFIIMICLL